MTTRPGDEENHTTTDDLTTDDLTTEELSQVTGGSGGTADNWYCNSQGKPVHGEGRNASGWKYDPTTGTCVPSNYVIA